MNNENEGKTVIEQNFHFYAPIGQQIAHVDKIEAHFDKDMNMVVNGKPIGMDDASAVGKPAEGSSPDEAWIDEIVSSFMGDRTNALEFVRMARNLQPKQITGMVNAWLLQKKISELSFNSPLWKPLHEHGIYPRGLSNWNDQVHLP